MPRRTHVAGGSSSECRTNVRTGALVSDPPRGNGDAESDDGDGEQHPVLERDQTEHQKLLDQPVLQGKPPRLQFMATAYEMAIL